MALAKDAWLSEYEEAAKLADEVAAKVLERNEMVRDNEDPARLVSATRRKLTILGSKADRLETLLKGGGDQKSRISEKEVKRRSDLLLALRFRAQQMSKQLNTAQPSNRKTLLGASGADAQKSGQVAETETTAGLDNRGVLILQRRTMQEQDDELADLEKNVKSTKHIAVAIKEELDLQSGLLDDMSADVDSTSSRMQVAQRKLISVTKRASKSCTCVSITALVCAMVLAIFIAVEVMKRL